MRKTVKELCLYDILVFAGNEDSDSDEWCIRAIELRDNNSHAVVWADNRVSNKRVMRIYRTSQEIWVR